MLQRVNFYQKRDKPQDHKEWIDRHSHETIFQQLLDLYQNCEYSFLEISLPIWPYAVLYMDRLYDDIKGDYIFPQHHIRNYQMETSFKHQVADAKLFDELYARANRQMPAPGHQTGDGASTFHSEDWLKALEAKARPDQMSETVTI